MHGAYLRLLWFLLVSLSVSQADKLCVGHIYLDLLAAAKVTAGMAEFCKNNKFADRTDEQPTHRKDKMTQKRCVRVCVCTVTLCAIIRLPHRAALWYPSYPHRHNSTAEGIVGRCLPVFLLPQLYVYYSTDLLSAKVDNANHHPHEPISQKSQIARLMQPDLAFWCYCAN